MSCYFAVVLLAGCQGDDRLAEYELAGPVMGTSFSVKLVDPPVNVGRDELGQRIEARLEAIEARFSTYRPSSEVSRLNNRLVTEPIRVSAELCSVVEAAIGISRRTNGAFDITVGPLVNLWGFGPDGDRVSPPSDDTVAEARASVGYQMLETDCESPTIRKALPGVYIDLSAYVKGYAVDQIAAILDDSDIANYLVEIGGELRMRGHNAERKNWAIAIEEPTDDARIVQSVIHISDSAVATSGDYRNFFEHAGIRYSHTIDPRTGRPVAHAAAAVTVVDDTAADADALATALLVLGPDEGLALAEHENIAAYFLVRDRDDIRERASGPFKALRN